MNEVRGAVEKVPVIPALKAVVAHHAGDPAWVDRAPAARRARRPRHARPLLATSAALGFAMPGLRG